MGQDRSRVSWAQASFGWLQSGKHDQLKINPCECRPAFTEIYARFLQKKSPEAATFVRPFNASNSIF